MAQRIVRTAAALATAALLALPTPALADTEHASPGADPHASHESGHGETKPTDPPADADTASTKPDPHAGHDMGADPSEPDKPEQGAGGHDDHGTTPESGGHDDHGEGEGDGDGHEQLPDTVSPEVRNLVLSGFAGVNAAVILGAFLVRRTGSNPDPRKNRPGRAAR